MSSGNSAATAVEIPHSLPAWQRWLGAEVLPHWTAKVAAEPAGYVECLSQDGRPDGRIGKTTLVTARLVYTFSHAHVLGLGPEALRAAEHGFRFLVERCWDNAEGGFLHQLTAAGEALDGSKHAYDLAFVLLAMAWFHRATGRREPLDWAGRTLDYLDATLRDRQGRGYRVYHRSDEPALDPLPRELNANMHLLEAFHALFAATRDGSWLARAEEMVDHLRNHLLDPGTGSLGEFFTSDWRPASGAAGSLRTPGNNFEVVWMLHNHARITGDGRAIDLAEHLYRFALHQGFERRPGFPPAAFAQVDRNGAILNDTKPLWAQTETIKAALARFETFGDGKAARFARAHLATLFGRYLIDRTCLWRSTLARDGSDLPAEIPVRVLYHLVLCFAETMRLWPTLAAVPSKPGESFMDE
jgi:mannose/cellobiose epimerase-like protein (N-acyl-D-glucosamine 2-epimerase family)